jgi:hypothetical protein
MLDARVKCTRYLVLLMSFIWTFACGDDDGSEDDSHAIEVAKFELNECKRASSENKLLSGRETSDYLGLECVAWNVGSRGFAIDLINREESCGFDGAEDETLWTPTARQPSAEKLELNVEWKFEGASACGGCRHDFSVVLNDVSIEHDLTLAIATRGCNAKDCDWTRDSVALPVTEARSGIRCKYVDWVGESPSYTETAQGKLHGPARGSSCDDGLVATRVADKLTICLAPCAQDNDCPLDGLLSCSEGTCRLTAPW